MAKLAIKKASTDVTVYLFIQDSSVTTGAGLTGLTFETANLVASYVRPLAARAALTLATLAAADSEHSDGGFKEIDATNMPGIYRLDLSDAICATGVNSVVVMLKGAANMSPVVLEIQLTDFDLNDATPNVTVSDIANGAITAAAIAQDAIDADAIKADAITKIQAGLATPTNITAASGVTLAADQQVDVTKIGGEAISGNNATLKLKALDIRNSAGDALVVRATGSNGRGALIMGNGSGQGIDVRGGNTATGMYILGGENGGSGLQVQNQFSGGGAGLLATGANLGIYANGTNGDISADEIAAIKSYTAAILADTGTDGVKISAGSGAGQLDFTSGVVKANLAQILGTALTETSGLIAAGFKKFFNVATPTGTVNSLPGAIPGANGGLPTTDGTKVAQTVDLTAGQSIAANGGTVATVTTVTNAPTDMAKESTLTAMKGAEWTDETLAALMTAIDGISVSGASAAEVWAYASRYLSGQTDGLMVIGPVRNDGKIDAIAGDDYYNADGRGMQWSDTAWPDLTGATVSFISGSTTIAMTVVTAGSGEQTVNLDVPRATSLAMKGEFKFVIRATLSSTHVVTLLEGEGTFK